MGKCIKINKDNLKLLRRYLNRARITGELANSSIIKYESSLKKFFSMINKEVSKLELDDFDDFVLKMQSGGASSSRICNIIFATKWFIRKLDEDGKGRTCFELEDIRKPKIGKKLVNYLTEDEVKIFLTGIKEDIQKEISISNVRMMVLCLFLLETGARIGEALSINIEDIDRQNMEIPIIGKGNKPRTLFIKKRSLRWIDKYLSMRGGESNYLFTTLRGDTRWGQTDVGRSFRRFKKMSGLKKEFTLHTLRHTFATQLLLKGVPLNSVQFLLGHSNPETTLRYYIGAIEKQKARTFIQDKYYDFINE